MNIIRLWSPSVINILQERTEKEKVIRAHDVYLDGGVQKWLVVLPNHLIGNQL